MQFRFVPVDAQNFGNIVLVNFEGKEYPYLAK